jgi:transcriptional regulator with XRE-family HTH domain
MKRTPPIEKCYANLGQRIRHLRQMKPMSQDALATQMGLTRTSIVNIEQGRQRVMLHDIRAFADVFKIPVERFILSILSEESAQ